MSKLSPAAQAVLDAFKALCPAPVDELAAALRAIELELAYVNDYGDYLISAEKLVAIADELEAQ